MIKINKLENVYGIKGLRGAKDLKRISVIYAPNGTAKTSISDALQCIGDGKQLIDITDVYGMLSKPSFEIDVDGKNCTEVNRIAFKVIKYSGINDFSFVSEGNYANIVMSPQVSSQVAKAMLNINSLTESINTLIDNCFPSKCKSNEYKEALSILANSSIDDPDLFLKLIQNIDLTRKPLPIIVSETMFLDLVNKKVKDMCSSQDVINNANRYFDVINNTELFASRPVYFDNNFTLDNLYDLNKNAIKNRFYKSDEPERKLYIAGEVYDESGIKLLIDSEIKRIYGTSEAKAIFDEIAKHLKGKKKVVDILSENPILISKLNDYRSMIEELFITIISSNISTIKKLLNDIVEHQSSINNVKNNYNADDNIITRIWNEFKSRFKFKKFDLRIDNEFNAVIGKEVPVFNKYIPNTDKPIDDPKKMRFSTGEIKTFNLINFIISVEALKEKRSPFTIILDDAVDSFDYKNKYGIIDYLVSLKDDPNIQLIVFTHNFDFYRTIILAIGRDNVGQYFAYRNAENEVEFYDTSKKPYLLQVTNFNNWKNNPTPAKYFALIPFSRNVLQLETKSCDNSVKAINEFIHYSQELTIKTINDIDAILKDKMHINKPKCFNGNEKYLEELDKLIYEIVYEKNIIDETDLEFKIAIGLYIRIFLERFLYKKYVQENNCDPVTTNESTKTIELIKQSLSLLSNDEKTHVIEANIISPAYTHVNSFMYEPLIDVGTTDLIDSAKWIHEKNREWPL